MKTTLANINFLYEDDWVLVCVKPTGLPVQTRQVGCQDLESLLRIHVAQTKKDSPYLAVLHRLDQPVEGILVFAKTPAAAKELNRQIAAHQFVKEYTALTCGIPSPASGKLCGYLQKDGRTNTSHVCPEHTQGAKYAELSYQVLRDRKSVV